MCANLAAGALGLAESEVVAVAGVLSGGEQKVCSAIVAAPRRVPDNQGTIFDPYHTDTYPNNIYSEGLFNDADGNLIGKTITYPIAFGPGTTRINGHAHDDVPVFGLLKWGSPSQRTEDYTMYESSVKVVTMGSEDETLSVTKQAVRAEGGEIKVTRSKTDNSMRKIAIPQEAIDLLVQEHAKHPDNPYMFPSPKTGYMYCRDSIVNLHKKILKDAGLEHPRFHDLRQTFATMALRNGVVVKTMSSTLGRYNPGFTLSTYAHATRQMQEDAAQKMGSFVTQAI